MLQHGLVPAHPQSCAARNGHFAGRNPAFCPLSQTSAASGSVSAATDETSPVPAEVSRMAGETSPVAAETSARADETSPAHGRNLAWSKRNLGEAGLDFVSHRRNLRHGWQSFAQGRRNLGGRARKAQSESGEQDCGGEKRRCNCRGSVVPKCNLGTRRERLRPQRVARDRLRLRAKQNRIQ